MALLAPKNGAMTQPAHLYWNELERFRAALIDAFNVDGLEQMLRYKCGGRQLENLSGRNLPRPKIVADIIDDARREGWLDQLAAGALAANPTHAALQDAVQSLLAAGDLQRHLDDLQEAGGTPLPDTIYADLRLYLQWMRDKSSNLPLGPLDPSGRDSDIIGLSDVFVALDVDKAGRAKMADGSDAVYHAALGHLHSRTRLILLGDPGSGKSTLLRYLALYLCNALLDEENDWLAQLAWTLKEPQDETRSAFRSQRDEEEKREQQHWQRLGLVPIFIQLRDFARQSFDPTDGNALWRYACAQLPEQLDDARPHLQTLALHKRLFFMFDGVDEVPPRERRLVWGAIGAFMRSPFGGNRWAATCRTLSYVEAELPMRHLPLVTLQKLNQEQIDRFIACWYRALQGKHEMTPADAHYMTAALQEAGRGHLHELAQNPMLLTIMAIVQTYEGQLPDERAMLYQRCVETLLLRWQREKDKDDQNAPSILQQLETSQAQLEQLLWRLGWEAHSQARQREQAADLPEWDVIQIAREQLGSLEKAERFLTYTERKAHLLVGAGGADDRRFTFPHRTFQEYLAACYLESERQPLRRIARLAESGDPWREVLNLAFGRLMHVKNDRVKAIDIVVDKLMVDELPSNEAGWRRLWLTGEACAVIGQEALLQDEAGAEVLPLLRQQLVALLENEALTPQQRAEAGDALGSLGDPRPGVCTREPEILSRFQRATFFIGNEKETRYH